MLFRSQRKVRGLGASELLRPVQFSSSRSPTPSVTSIGPSTSSAPAGREGGKGGRGEGGREGREGGRSCNRNTNFPTGFKLNILFFEE